MTAARTYSQVMAEAMAAHAHYHELMAEAFSLSDFSEPYKAHCAEHHTKRCAEQRERAEHYAARAARAAAEKSP